MSHVADLIVIKLFTATWQVILLASVVWLVCRLGHRWISPRWRFVFWGLVLVRLASPVWPESHFSAYQWFTSNTESVAIPDSVPQTVETEISRTSNDSAINLPADAIVDSIDRTPPRSQNALPATDSINDHSQLEAVSNWKWSWAVWVCLFWLVGVTSLLMRQWSMHRLVSQLMRDWKPADTEGRLLDIFRDCQRELMVRRVVRLWTATGHEGPAALGIWRPGIVFPEPLATTLSDTQLQLILRHELAHVRRKDVLWDCLASWVVYFHWFNPVAWWARSYLRRERELACDELAVQNSDASQVRAYGDLLVQLATNDQAVADTLTPVGIGAHFHDLKRRIHMVARQPQWNWQSRVIGVLVLSVLLFCGLTQAVPKSTVVGPASAEKPSEAETEYRIAGQCVDEKLKPLSQVRLQVYRVNSETIEREKVAETRSDATGRFEFSNLPHPVKKDPNAKPGADYLSTYYVLTASKPNWSSGLRAFHTMSTATDHVDVKLRPAATLKGHVADASGKPIAGAKVFTSAYPYRMPFDGLRSATTDAEGYYEITDMGRWNPADSEPHKVGPGAYDSIGACYFSILHPEYGEARPVYTHIPATVDVTLERAAKIVGTVIDEVTGRPRTDAIVSMQGVDPTNAWQQTRTDKDGQYQLTSVAPGNYNIRADAPDRTCVAIDSLQIESDQTYRNQDLTLIEGGWIEGRLVDARNDKPLPDVANRSRFLQLAIYGPSRPKSGAAVTSALIDENGRFRIRVAPGVNYPYIMQSDIWNRVENRADYEAGIQVAAGELVQLTFRVLQELPRPKRPSSPVRLPVPVPDERQAAQAIRELGGWYQTDDDGHVVEVNMVYHYTKERVRHNNPQTNSADALKWLPSFSRLKRLLLKEGQANDAELVHVAKLTHLEIFFVWDAAGVSDAGMKHLRSLKSLKRIHVNGSQIRDEALTVFGTLGKLEELSLQGNNFTDAGFQHLTELEHLKTLWVGMNQTPLTNAATASIGKLVQLEQLDLQDFQLTDEGIQNLAALKQLRSFFFEGRSATEKPTVTDASLDVLLSMKNLTRLYIQEARLSEESVWKLAALPKLEQLSIEPVTISKKTKNELKEKYPDRSFNLIIR